MDIYQRIHLTYSVFNHIMISATGRNTFNLRRCAFLSGFKQSIVSTFHWDFNRLVNWTNIFNLLISKTMTRNCPNDWLSCQIIYQNLMNTATWSIS